jgi:hypothetical protein
LGELFLPILVSPLSRSPFTGSIESIPLRLLIGPVIDPTLNGSLVYLRLLHRLLNWLLLLRLLTPQLSNLLFQLPSLAFCLSALGSLYP